MEEKEANIGERIVIALFLLVLQGATIALPAETGAGAFQIADRGYQVGPVATHDVGCTRIIAPVGTIDSGTVVTPACSLYNYGDSIERYTVRLKIGALYSETAAISGHVPGTHRCLVFPSWTALPVGPIAASCSTRLSTDADPSNDRLVVEDTVRRLAEHDVGCSRIISPAADADSGFPLTPTCSLFNYGSNVESYRAVMRIGSSYAESVSVIDYVPRTAVVATFPSLTPIARGSQVAKCSTELGDDLVPGNDRQLQVFTVQVMDVQCIHIAEPQGSIDSGDVVIPIGIVYNNGTAPIGFWAMMRIWDATHPDRPGYLDQESTYLTPGGNANVTFWAWSAHPRGTMTVRCSTMYDRELHHENDRKTSQFRVRVLDVAAVGIWAPRDSVGLHDSIVPVVQVTNYGTDNAEVTATLSIGGWQRSRSDTLVPGVQDVIIFPLWVAETLGTFPVSFVLYLDGDVHPENNLATESVSVWGATGVRGNEAEKLPLRFALSGARPNPAREGTVVRYELAQPAFTRICVFDIRGELIRVLAAKPETPGRHDVAWDCRDATSKQIAPGVYLCRMTAGPLQATSKVLVTR